MRNGSKNGRAKLNEQAVKEIREYWKLFYGRQDLTYGAGNHRIVSGAKLAKQHHISISAMYALLKNETWKHI